MCSYPRRLLRSSGQALSLSMHASCITAVFSECILFSSARRKAYQGVTYARAGPWNFLMPVS